MTKTKKQEEDIIFKKALLFIPATKENLDYCEESNILSLVTEEAILVDVAFLKNEEELQDTSLYDVYIDGKLKSMDIPSEWLTLVKH